jgi:hypothetical protein
MEMPISSRKKTSLILGNLRFLINQRGPLKHVRDAKYALSSPISQIVDHEENEDNEENQENQDNEENQYNEEHYSDDFENWENGEGGEGEALRGEEIRGGLARNGFKKQHETVKIGKQIRHIYTKGNKGKIEYVKWRGAFTKLSNINV